MPNSGPKTELGSPATRNFIAKEGALSACTAAPPQKVFAYEHTRWAKVLQGQFERLSMSEMFAGFDFKRESVSHEIWPFSLD